MTRRLPVRRELLHERLDALVATFDVSTISPDPLEIALRYADPLDQEVAGLLAAAFAYGRAEMIVANIGGMVGAMTPSPFAYLASFNRAGAKRRFIGFAHRFHKTPELLDLFETIAVAIREHGSVGALFRKGYRSDDPDIGPSLERFVDALIEPVAPRRSAGKSGRRRALEYLLSSPANGSACKRMNLYLRWMVRPTPPDLGIWTFVDTAQLVMPVDTHIHRIATFLGLNDRRSADWKAARTLTDRLARFDPADPVRYDFALCRLGILDLCSRKVKKEQCEVCMLRDVCSLSLA
ncbi:MAG: TIGR02757 family protein [Acidobacteriota bacterium]